MRAEWDEFDLIVIGGGHAGAEAAWAGANLGARVALVTLDPDKIGAMSCNPAIGGLAKGQIVREIDAMGGLMARAADAAGIQFRMLNASKGPAVRGPRCQADKYRYAREVQRLLRTRPQITILQGAADRFLIERDIIRGVVITTSEEGATRAALKRTTLRAPAVVLTTGTFMRGLMHTGEAQTPGGRIGEAPAVGISATLRELGFELGRLKTGTPPRLAAESIDFAALELQPGDEAPQPFSDHTDRSAFPVLPQQPCWITHTTAQAHDAIRANLDRAPMYNGQIDNSAGPRYCPSIEDKVVRFADRPSHHVFLEPESLDTNEIYCNGISTSLPTDVQDTIVRALPGCENARIIRYGYAVEYDMVWPHQIDATCMTNRIGGLFLAGQINGTSGYEEAAGQGLIAGLNAVRHARGLDALRLRRDQAYIGVLMDDLVTKTPREPYRMFTSRAEHRLLLRADNADIRLTPLARECGLINDEHWCTFQARRHAAEALTDYFRGHKVSERRMIDWVRQPGVTPAMVLAELNGDPLPPAARDERIIARVLADIQYEGYIRRQHQEVERLARQEAVNLPGDFNFDRVQGLRNEARHVLTRFQPTTLGQASRLAGVTPADVMLLSVAIGRG